MDTGKTDTRCISLSIHRSLTSAFVFRSICPFKVPNKNQRFHQSINKAVKTTPAEVELLAPWKGTLSPRPSRTLPTVMILQGLWCDFFKMSIVRSCLSPYIVVSYNGGFPQQPWVFPPFGSCVCMPSGWWIVPIDPSGNRLSYKHTVLSGLACFRGRILRSIRKNLDLLDM